MMAVNLIIEQRKWILKQYWKTEMLNVKLTESQYLRRTINTIPYTIQGVPGGM